MQFFFRGLLVAAITYFLKLGHNNHGLIFTVVTLASYWSYKQWAFYGSYKQWAFYGP